YLIDPPSRILAALCRRMATRSPRSNHVAFAGRQAGTNPGVVPKASQKSCDVRAARGETCKVLPACQSHSTALPAAVSTASRSAFGRIDILSAFSMFARSWAVHVKERTRFLAAAGACPTPNDGT